MSSMMPPSGGQEQMLRSPTNTNPFPNMARNRDQMDMLWRHIASVLSAGIRERAMAGEQPAEGLTPIRDEKRGQVPDASLGSWERAMGQQLTPLPSDFEMESRMSQGEIGPGEFSREFEQKPDPSLRNSSALSAEEIAQAAFNAGFRGEDLAISVAIGLAESRGNPMAHNTDGLDDSYGIWQINMYGDDGPRRRRLWGLSSDDQLFDLATNARVAYDLYRGRIQRGEPKFEDWSVWSETIEEARANPNSYLNFWDVARRAAASVESSSSEVR